MSLPCRHFFETKTKTKLGCPRNPNLRLQWSSFFPSRPRTATGRVSRTRRSSSWHLRNSAECHRGLARLHGPRRDCAELQSRNCGSHPTQQPGPGFCGTSRKPVVCSIEQELAEDGQRLRQRKPVVCSIERHILESSSVSAKRCAPLPSCSCTWQPVLTQVFFFVHPLT